MQVEQLVEIAVDCDVRPIQSQRCGVGVVEKSRQRTTIRREAVRVIWGTMMTSSRLCVAAAVSFVILGGVCVADDSTERLLARAAEAAGIQIVHAAPKFPVETNHGLIEGTAATPRAVSRYAPLLAREWALYPRSLVERAKVRRIVLCADLAFAGQRRSAVPDFEHDTLYLDAARGMHDGAYARKVIHHEFFHMIDWQDDFRLYEDRDWAKLNPEGFRYGAGGVHAQDDASMSLASTATPGFVNRYATTGVEEDKAEVFAHMMVNRAALDARAREDKVLRAKIARIEALLAEFCPDVDANFWKRLRSGAALRDEASAR